MAPNTSGANSDCSVRVAVRVRPLLSFEKTERLGECVGCVPSAKQVYVGSDANGKNTFTFDYTFPKEREQKLLYEDCVTPLLEAFFEGFNATILAYGQTGSGKTYTMGSASSLRLSEEEQGIIPRVINSMFDMIRDSQEQRLHVVYTIRCQFLEIYGEDLHDLLEPAGSSVTIREGESGEVNVHGAKEELVQGAEDMAMLLERGSLCRTTGSTLMNAHSSRSHAIFTVLLEQRIGQEGGDQENKDDVEIRRSKFHFVDLAGSERAKRTGASGQRFKEGVDINKGLLTLGNVISALGDDTKRGRVHVPYRDSKLTRMLQDSLGGNSQTLMICCVSPAESNMHETLSALRYANRARNIRNKPVVNRDHNSAIINELKQQVQVLAAELLRLREGGSLGGGTADDSTAGSGTVPTSSLRELAAITPSRGLPHLRAGSLMGVAAEDTTKGGGSREVTMLRSRAAEAEGEVIRLMEEAKAARMRVSETQDRLVEVCAERDLLKLTATGGGGLGADEVILEIVQAGEEAGVGVGPGAEARVELGVGVEEGKGEGRTRQWSPSPRGSSSGGRRGTRAKRSWSPSKNHKGSSISGVIKGLFSSGGGGGGGGGEAPDGSSAGGSGQCLGAEQDSGGKQEDSPKARAFGVLRAFHEQIRDLELRLRDSERHRSDLERQLVRDSGGGGRGGGEGGGAAVAGGV
ncbi:unnamed protein product, partial [Discosporangium mesarthrocarpum]